MIVQPLADLVLPLFGFRASISLVFFFILSRFAFAFCRWIWIFSEREKTSSKDLSIRFDLIRFSSRMYLGKVCMKVFKNLNSIRLDERELSLGGF